ncbi:hypothetical protein NEOLEDRAFT_1241814 [Neolentinus lepideus HHB14362 ss-1]|uniref:Uncharacterized protein n=1 Tax=Neolentinus lepideus HHB14362 ss-1 TaxID=1314782 RepID=A0A165SLM3_9AGAM|nr:hypothetical protein NEOLEDRAFT_1241814 [Neolentinus lepideus HHB14362 ss-1]
MSIRLDTAVTLRPPAPDHDALPSSPCAMAQSPPPSRSPSPSHSCSPTPSTPSTFPCTSLPAALSTGCQLPSALPSVAPRTSRGHVRRRRSSLSLNVSSLNASLGQLKSPQRSVNVALQRQRQLIGGMSPGRARRATVGDTAMDGIKEENANDGRARSNSFQIPMSGALPVFRTRRKLRLPLAPALPPPTAPLPPIPSQYAMSSFPRQPFTLAHSSNSMAPLESPLTLNHDFTDKLLNAMSMSQSPIEIERVQWEVALSEEETGDGMKEN